MAGTGTAHLHADGTALLRADELVVEFPASGGRVVSAVAGISLDVIEGETLGLVGESGCGKSTTGRALIQLPPPTSGKVQFDNVELTSLKRNDLREMRPRMQMIFQDPISSLNPRRRVGDIVAEGLEIWKIGDAASRVGQGRRSAQRGGPRSGDHEDAVDPTSSPAGSASGSPSRARS